MVIEFLIIVIGIVASIVICIRKICVSSVANDKFVESEVACRRFREQFTDGALEKEIVHRIGDKYQLSAIYEELEPDLIEVFGENYREKFEIWPSVVKGDFIDKPTVYGNYWAKMLLLSKKGKYPCSRKIELGRGEMAYTNLKLCQIIQRNIREYDPTFQLCRRSDVTTRHYPVDSVYGRVIIPECDFYPPELSERFRI